MIDEDEARLMGGDLVVLGAAHVGDEPAPG